MKIYKPQLIAFMNSYSQGKSGGDMVFIEVAKRIKEYDKMIVTSRLGKDLCQKSGLKGKYLITTREPEFRHLFLTYFQRILKAFFLKLSAGEKDILLSTSDFLPDVLPAFWRKLKSKKTKWVQHIFHLVPPSRKGPFFAQKISFLFIKPLADLIIVDNRQLKNDLIKLGFSSDRVFVNSPGIDLQRLKLVKKEGVGYDGIFMAQLRSSKGIFDLVKIWQRVCQAKPTLKLGIMGRGMPRMVKRIKSLIKAEGLEKNINLLGYLEDKEAFTTIKASRVFIFPSREEGFGIAPLEAQACGLPVVAWNLPVYREVFKGGIVKVKTGQLKKFAEAVVELLTDNRFYRKLAKEAVDNANQYDWNRVAKRELEIIKK
ncbi:glycosyltransferase family 4 protein [Patescibacteria group bacterium]|nr:glycosyltransferase family 4 protein [Patescibacteria group bacterium]